MAQRQLTDCQRLVSGRNDANRLIEPQDSILLTFIDE